jgi:short-subunit dehydrogenase
MKNILILGATSDIAQAAAYEFAQAGFSFTLAARDSDRLAALKSDLEIKHNATVYLADFDATDFASHHGFYDQLPSKPDVVLLAFGYFFDEEDRQNVPFEEVQKLIDINYTGAVSILNIIANDFETRKTGFIMGISSVAGDRGRGSHYWYGSTKAGVSAYLGGLRHRLSKHGIHVTTIKPGIVHTKMTRDIDKPKPFAVQPDRVGKDIYRAYENKKTTLYTPWIWYWVMLVIRNLPEKIFQKTNL